MASLVETMQEMEERLEQLTAESEQSAAAASPSGVAAVSAEVGIRHAWTQEEHVETHCGCGNLTLRVREQVRLDCSLSHGLTDALNLCSREHF